MPRSPPVPRPRLAEVIRGLSRAAAGSLDARAHAALQPFTKHARWLSPASARKLGRYAREHLADVTALVASSDATVRHAAAYALGQCEDRRAVEPLMGLLCQQQDFYDHDFAYAALRDLGRRALPRLERFALEGSEQEAYQAVQALGQSAAGALPCLRRVLASRSPLPKSFFTAYENTHDPRGLPDLIPYIRSGDDRTRHDALFAAAGMLRMAARRSTRRPRGAAPLADVLAPLCLRENAEERATAIECLGWLRDARHLGMLIRLSLSTDEDLARTATLALTRYRTKGAQSHLAELLAHDDLERATTAAVGLLEDRGATRAARTSASQVAVRGLATLPGNSAWCSAAILCRESLRLRRAVCEAIRLGEGPERERLAKALAFSIPPRPPLRRVFERRVLATCSPEIEPVVAAAIRARFRKMGY